MSDKLACPKCQSTEFYGGPEGGGAQNILCAGCHTEYWYGGPFGLEDMNSSPERIKTIYGIDVSVGPAVVSAAQDREGESVLDSILGNNDGESSLAN